MSRVALFFDGKNHMSDLQRSHADLWIDHGRLAAFLVEQVGGDELVAAHYYTGVPTGLEDPPPTRALADLLRQLERVPGFFVHRFPRTVDQAVCESCGHSQSFTREKRVDTTMVADIVRLASIGAFDVAVLCSGDLDFAPALDAVHQLGRKAWVATFGAGSLSAELRRHAWSTVDLSKHVDAFALGELEVPASLDDAAPSDADREVLRELRRAQQHFAASGGFVGTHYFLARWRGRGMPEGAPARRDALERLMAAGLVETYQVNGRAALRALAPAEE